MSIPWIQLTTKWIGSDKELHLRILLQDSEWAWTYPVRLWMWTGQHKTEGRIEGPGCVEKIAMAANWQGSPQIFVEALVTARLLDETSAGYYVHDWHDYAGRFLEKREKTRERLKAFRERQRTKRVTRTKRVRNADVPAGNEPVRGGEREQQGEEEEERLKKKQVYAHALNRPLGQEPEEQPERKILGVVNGDA